jgi:ComEC/Rec2-related protein
MKPSKRMSMSLVIQVDEVFEFEENPNLDKIKTSVPMRHLNGAILGDTLILRTSLYNNDRILFPGGYDFGFKSKYEGIQASGYCSEKIKIVKNTREKNFWSIIFDIRNYIYSKFLKNMTRDHANFAAAIILGETGGLSSETLNNMRLAGISHILCVSGLHLSLITGIFFVSIRFLLNFSDYIVFRVNIKKIAGFFAIIASIMYLYLSGLQIAATRAFIMTTIFMIAIIFDRSIYPIRSISLATMIMLTQNPEYLYHPSFQLSFMAVLSLISGFEIFSQNKHLIVSQTNSLFSRIYFYLISNIYSSILASVFTAPIVVYHFYFFSNYSIIANLVAVPIMSFFMMPIAIFSLFLMPIGLEKYPLKLLEFFIDIVIKSAKYIVALPHSIWQIGYISKWSLTLFLGSFFWFVIWKSKIRYLGLGISFLSFAFMLNSEKPALILDISNQENTIDSEMNQIQSEADSGMDEDKNFGMSSDDVEMDTFEQYRYF